MTHHDQVPEAVKEANLYFAVRAIFPNAAPLWQGAPNHDTAIVEWMDGFFVVTPEWDDRADGRYYVIGLYDSVAAWTDLGEAATYLDLWGRADVVKYLDDITDLQPEGTDFWAWAVQWTHDGLSDRRIAGLREEVTDGPR